MQKDTPVFDLLSKELKRQREGIELIASENFTSMAVMQAMGSVATNGSEYLAPSFFDAALPVGIGSS